MMQLLRCGARAGYRISEPARYARRHGPRPLRAVAVALVAAASLALAAEARDPGDPSGEAILAGQSDSLEFARVWEQLLTEAGINAEFVTAPHGRKRRMFIDGVIVLDCCASPVWRQAPEEQAVQLFSDVFYLSAEHYVFRAGHGIDMADQEQAKKLRYAKVRGFYYPEGTFPGQTFEVRDMNDVLDMLATGRVDVGIVNREDFDRRMKAKPRPLELGPVYFMADLRVRVHKSRADLLPAINTAIARLKADGTIERILEGALAAPTGATSAYGR